MASWRRTFWAVWFANLITAVGMMAFLPFFPSHLEELGLTDRAEIATWAGVLFGAAPLSAAIASPLWGALGDRFGRRLMVLRSMLGITVFVGAMALARTPGELLALRVAQGLFSGFIAPSMTLVSVVTPQHQQGRVSSALNSSMVWGAIFGPALGELVRVQYGMRAVYAGVALLAGASALLVLAFADEVHSSRGPARGFELQSALRESFGDLRELRAKGALRSAVALMFWTQFGLGATNPTLDLFVRDLPSHVAWLAPTTGALFSAAAAASLLAMPMWGRYGDRRGAYPALIRCATFSAIALLLQGASPSYESMLAARIAFGAAMAGSGPLAFGVAAAESSADQRGGAMGIVFAARALSIAIAASAGGALAAWLGIRTVFFLSGVVLLACVWLGRRSVSQPGATTPA